MAVFRVEKNANYTTMSNYHLRDKQLSLKAKGLLSFCLSLPDTWDYSIMGLAAVCKEGRDCIMSTLQELEELGYLRRERTRNADGTLAGADYVIYELPQPVSEKPDSGQLSKRNQLPAIFLFMRHPEALANRSPPPEKGLLLGLVLNKKSKPRAEKQEIRAFPAKTAL